MVVTTQQPLSPRRYCKQSSSSGQLPTSCVVHHSHSSFSRRQHSSRAANVVAPRRPAPQTLIASTPVSRTVEAKTRSTLACSAVTTPNALQASACPTAAAPSAAPRRNAPTGSCARKTVNASSAARPTQASVRKARTASLALTCASTARWTLSAVPAASAPPSTPVLRVAPHKIRSAPWAKCAISLPEPASAV